MPDEDQGPWLAAEKKPYSGEEFVEVYELSLYESAAEGEWTPCAGLGLSPWHIWRFYGVASEEPSEELRGKASKNRRELGVEPLGRTGIYVREKSE